MVGQHVPGLRLRRPLAPVLVLVRAQPGLDAHLLPPARDRGLPAARRRRDFGVAPPRAAAAPPSPAPRGTRRRAAGRSRPSRGALQRARAHLGRGRAERPKRARHPGARALRGPHVPLRAVGPRLRRSTGKRVAVIGTGASAIQFVPAIAAEGRADARLPAHRAVGHAPHRPPDLRAASGGSTGASRSCRSSSAAASTRAASCSCSASSRTAELMKVAEKLARRAHGQPDLRSRAARARSTPDYTIGCKRILPSNQLVSGARARQRRAGHRRDRRGPRATRSSPSPARSTRSTRSSSAPASTSPTCRSPSYVRGRGGRTLAEHWEGSPRAHLGSTVPGFPNLFMLLGPNTGLGHSSMVYMIESQVAYVMAALRTMRDARGRGSPRCAARSPSAYNARARRADGGHGLDHRLLELVPRRHGRNATLWPDWTFRFRRRASRFEPASTSSRAQAGAGARGGVSRLGPLAGA